MDPVMMNAIIAAYEKNWSEQFTIMELFHNSKDDLPEHEHKKEQYNYQINALINQRKGMQILLNAIGYSFRLDNKTKKFTIEKL